MATIPKQHTSGACCFGMGVFTVALGINNMIRADNWDERGFFSTNALPR